MPLSLQQVQKLSQRLIMTPQMQLSVKLLQMNSMELDELAQQEVLENPFLEMEEGLPDEGNDPLDFPEKDDSDLEETIFADLGDAPENAGDAPEDNSSEADRQDAVNSDADVLTASSDGAEGISFGSDDGVPERPPEQFGEVDLDWTQVFDEDMAHLPSYRSHNPDLDDRSMEEVVAGRSSLYEVLSRQLRLSSLEGEGLRIGEYLIGSIDDRGYLQVSLEECAKDLGVDLASVEKVLGIIQEFDPTGVGARNLPECLRIQLAAIGQLTPLASQILEKHWTNLLRKKFKEIARSLEVDEKEVQSIFETIGRLNPSPGTCYGKEQPQFITPDVYVKKMDNEYICYLNEGQVAHLRLSNIYRDILLNNDNADPKAREYAMEKYRAAVGFIKNIEKRRSTILRVTEAIMEYQRDFLEKGVEALKPLALSEIANTVGMHESTISRVTSGKYVNTPQGLFELKFFFSSAIESDSGEAASSRSIKQKIRELVDEEDPRHPLSDDKIMRILKTQGFTIARRTVAKYREQMKILPTNLRKQTQ